MNDERVLAYALTHPHADHAGGVVELFERFGAVVDRVAITPLLISEPGPGATTGARIVSRQVAMALKALEKAVTNGAMRVELVDGGDFCSHPEVSFAILSPLAAECSRPVTDANELSAVITVQYRSTLIVLGSDLPTRARHGQGGWTGVTGRRVGLGGHRLLKIPHHGSSTSHHAPLFSKHAGSRVWVVTPYNSSKLPNVTRMDGLAWIIARGRPVHLTAPPVSKAVQVPVSHPGQMSVDGLRERVAVKPTGIPLIDGRAIELTRRAVDAEDTLWCFAIGDDGAVVGRWRGRAALEIVG
jgi:hypothetical protein